MNATNKWMRAFLAADAEAAPAAVSANSAVSHPPPHVTASREMRLPASAARPQRIAAGSGPNGANCANGPAWTPEDWIAFFHERAAMVADEGLPEADVTVRAFEGCVEEWLRQQVPPARSDLCAFCGSADGERDRLVPFGIVSTGQWWVHPRCQPDWTAARHAEATEALRGMSLGSPPAASPAHDDIAAPAFSATNPNATAASSFSAEELRAALTETTEVETVPGSEPEAGARMDTAVIGVEALIDRVPPVAAAPATATIRRVRAKTGRPPGRPRRDAPRVETRLPWRGPGRLLFYAIIDRAQNRLPATFTLEQLRVYVEHPLLLAEVERMVEAGFFDVVSPQAYRLREPYRKTAARPL